MRIVTVSLLILISVTIASCCSIGYRLVDVSEDFSEDRMREKCILYLLLNPYDCMDLNDSQMSELASVMKGAKVYLEETYTGDVRLVNGLSYHVLGVGSPIGVKGKQDDIATLRSAGYNAWAEVECRHNMRLNPFGGSAWMYRLVFPDDSRRMRFEEVH